MEFGTFDDDLFTEPEKKPKKAATVDYKPKTVTPQVCMSRTSQLHWYTEEQAIPKEDVDKVHFYIFRGNRHYFQGEWSCALEAFTRAMDFVAPNNTSMSRLLLESLGRCRWRCKDASGAVEMGKKLVEESTNDHQLFGAHSVLAMFYHEAGNTKDQANCLRHCLEIRPLSVQHWIHLAKIYLMKIPSKDCQQMPVDDRVENTFEMKGHIGQCCDEESTGLGNCHGAIQRTNDYCTDVESGPAAQDSSAYHGDTRTKKGLDQPRGINCAHSIGKDEHVLNTLQGDQQHDGTGSNFLSYGTNVNDTACESRHLNHNSSSSESVKFGCSPAAGENISRRSPTSAVGQDIGVIELEKLERLSISGEGTAMAKDSQPTGLEEDIDGGGDKLEESDPIMEAVTCLLKAQVILKSLQICAVSMTKIRNAQLLAEIDGLLSTLHLEPAFLQDMSKKMYNEVFNKDIKEETTIS